MSFTTPYKMSRNYTELFDLICDGHEIPCFVDYSSRVDDNIKYRDICRVRRRGEYDISFGARGIGYCDISSWHKENGVREIDAFAELCKMLNIEFIVISDKKTYNFYDSEIKGFVESLQLVRVQLKQGVIEKRQIELNNKKMENSEIFQENKQSDVKDEDLKDQFDIKETLIETIKKVKSDKGYIPQANTICNITNQLINLKKLEFLTQLKK